MAGEKNHPVWNIVLIIALLWCVDYCAAEVIYVNVNGPNEPGTGTYENPFRRIQDGIDSADNGDTIIVAEGVYTGSRNRDLDPNGLAATIRSTDPDNPSVVMATVIDAGASTAEPHRGFYFHNSESADCIVAGFSITNGYTTGSGGGIYCLNSSPAITNCIITKNTAALNGGGIYCNNSQLTLKNCLISANKSTGGAGGGIRCVSSNPFITNCTISGNSAGYAGSAIYCFSSNPQITNSIIYGNSSGQIYAADGEPVITYSNIQDGWTGTGNIDADPCFACFDPNGDPNNWDFHLKSIYGRFDPNTNAWTNDLETSPCIDAGNPNSAWNDEPWPNGMRINMGFYGGTSQAGKNGNQADFNIDGIVDFADFALLAQHWMNEETCIEDLNGDGVINALDLAIFTTEWLW